MSDRGAFDPSALVGVLLAHAVDFVMIGGYAAELQGVRWMTVSRRRHRRRGARGQLRLLEAALLELDAWALVPAGSVQRIRPDVARLRTLTGAMLLRTRFGRLDIMKNAGADDAPLGYAELADDALEAELEGRPAAVA